MKEQESPSHEISESTFHLLLAQCPVTDETVLMLAQIQYAQDNNLHISYFFDGHGLSVEVSEKAPMQFKPKRRRK